MLFRLFLGLGHGWELVGFGLCVVEEGAKSTWLRRSDMRDMADFWMVFELYCLTRFIDSLNKA